MNNEIECIWCGCLTYQSDTMDGICRGCWEENQFAIEKQESLEHLENLSQGED